MAQELDPELYPREGLSLTNRVVITLILLSLLAVVLETEPAVYQGYEALFWYVEWFFLCFFGIEYLLRVWSCVDNPRYTSRWRYIFSGAALLDLLVIISFLLTALGATGFLLRLFRVIRVLRVARLGRFSTAWLILSEAIAARKYELMISAIVALGLLLVTSSLLYLVEGSTQPESFGSIPRAMWWSVATLTTVGYGDTYPITAMGRVLASFTAVAGIGLIAMPTGILAAAVSDAIQRRK